MSVFLSTELAIVHSFCRICPYNHEFVHFSEQISSFEIGNLSQLKLVYRFRGGIAHLCQNALELCDRASSGAVLQP
jgi:hypothetical protein